jgi:hypothetical protein
MLFLPTAGNPHERAGWRNGERFSIDGHGERFSRLHQVATFSMHAWKNG